MLSKRYKHRSIIMSTRINMSGGINSSGGNSNFDADIAKLAGLTVEKCNSYSESPVLKALYKEAKRGETWHKQPLMKRLTLQDKPIDVIIQYRRAEHFSSFGNKYFKDIMDNPKISSLKWGACLIPRMLTGTVYQLSKLGSSLHLSFLNPLSYVSVFLGLIGLYTPIFQGALKEQGIRTHLEGREVKVAFLDEDNKMDHSARVYLSNQAVYDKNKQLRGGAMSDQVTDLIESDEDKMAKVSGPIIAHFSADKSPRVLTITEKSTLSTEYEKLKIVEKDCLDLMPSLKNKSWFQKFQSDLEKMDQLSK